MLWLVLFLVLMAAAHVALAWTRERELEAEENPYADPYAESSSANADRTMRRVRNAYGEGEGQQKKTGRPPRHTNRPPGPKPPTKLNDVSRGEDIPGALRLEPQPPTAQTAARPG